VQVDGVYLSAEYAFCVAALQYLLGDGDSGGVQRLQRLGFGDVLSLVDVLDGDEPDEVRMGFMVIEGQLGRFPDGRDGIEMINVEPSLRVPYIRVWAAISSTLAPE
jgi:hypothetical protein